MGRASNDRSATCRSDVFAASRRSSTDRSERLPTGVRSSDKALPRSLVKCISVRQFLDKRLFAGRRFVDFRQVMLGGCAQDRLHSSLLKSANDLRDFASGDDQFTDEALQILDQLFLVRDENVQFVAVQVNRALDTSNENLCLCGQLIEIGLKRGKREMNLLRIAFRATGVRE